MHVCQRMFLQLLLLLLLLMVLSSENFGSSLPYVVMAGNGPESTLTKPGY